MKKKIVALFLALTLVVAMLIPAFAAVAQPDNTNACNHSWVDAGNIYVSGYEYKSTSEHFIRYKVPQICTLCAARQDNPVPSSASEGHTWYGSACSRCGYNRAGRILIEMEEE